MQLEQVQQILRQSPTVLIGFILGSTLMYVLGSVPNFIEVSWGPKGSYIRIDSRTEFLCDSAIADSSQ